MTRMLVTIAMAWVWLAGTAAAQERGVWVQVEAQPTLAQARARAEAYAAEQANVAGYALASGWFAVALGPYGGADASSLLRQLRALRSIPPDSFIVDGGNFRQQFFPVGVGAPTAPQALPGIGTAAPQSAATTPPIAEPAPEPAALPEPEPDETRAEAAQSEAALTREEKSELQVALQWAGVYNSTIDGLFGRGTRNAMAQWQQANGYEPTGILTTRQRAALFAAYNAVLEGMDLRRVADRRAGIAMKLPMGVVALEGYDPPFARYTATGDLPVTVLLISQPGNQDRLYGLYEIMQTLDIVPPDGPRERGAAGFTLEGQDRRIHSYTEVSLQDDQIKGFTLVWPAGDEERRARVLQAMRTSFERLPRVLDPAAAPAGEDQSVDLVSGLAIRQPMRTRTGVWIDAGGRVLTTAEAVAGCGEVTVDDRAEARVAHLDAALGIAVLAPATALAPVGVAEFQQAVPRLGSAIAVAGFPFGDVIAAPALTFGTLADIRGLERRGGGQAARHQGRRGRCRRPGPGRGRRGPRRSARRRRTGRGDVAGRRPFRGRYRGAPGLAGRRRHRAADDEPPEPGHARAADAARRRGGGAGLVLGVIGRDGLRAGPRGLNSARTAAATPRPRR